ncbi:hypothetical protein AWC38_SpisGene1947 [Stylophora pistillata]|uniref:Uncharacterized protein n=1 Tax=Stylophora pistillata TaxID=50429 RepID=A0A2B4STK5_STYPI|nr:hypothetical protein AWC38_SpisGene1947 [Stylophora pistillata]
MAERFADRVVLPVTAAIYINGDEKPAMRWSFVLGIGGESDKALFNFIVQVEEGFGIADPCSQLSIARFRVTISVKEFQVTTNCPKSRVFEIDSQKQWNAAITKLITKERELIVKVYEIELKAACTHISNSAQAKRAGRYAEGNPASPVPSKVAKSAKPGFAQRHLIGLTRRIKVSSDSSSHSDGL